MWVLPAGSFEGAVWARVEPAALWAEVARAPPPSPVLTGRVSSVPPVLTGCVSSRGGARARLRACRGESRGGRGRDARVASARAAPSGRRRLGAGAHAPPAWAWAWA